MQRFSQLNTPTKISIYVHDITILMPACRSFDTLIDVGYRYPGNSPTHHTNTIVIFTATPMVGVRNEKPNGRNNV
jgi:hypothetical protein